MGPASSALLLALFSIAVSGPAVVRALPRSTVTNEDIRDAILQVVNVVRTTDDKLERHEYRERLLGDNLKKGMISIDKRIKLLEPFKGTISRLDQRLAAVETILMQKDERERIQMEKTYETVEDIHNNLPGIVEKLKNEIIEKLSQKPVVVKPEVPSLTKKELEVFQNEVKSKLDQVSQSIKSLEKEVQLQKRWSEQHAKELNTKSSENFDKVKRQLNSSEQLLEKYETKLAEYNNRVPEVPQKSASSDHGEKILQALEVQKTNVELILSDVKNIASKFEKLPDKNDLKLVARPSSDYSAPISEIKQETLKIEKKLEELLEKDERKHVETLNTINNITEGISTLTDKFSTSYDSIKAEIENLGKVEQVMVQTADNVLDTRRRVEYGTLQIISEVKELIKKSSKDVDEAISERFDTFEMSILDEDNGALANVSSKIGHEIDRVWRQIGILYQQMSVSADTLNKLQNQTEAYVNGSLNAMDSMKGKVGTITSRITELDENLNYLMGKLLLVTQEFNQIKTGMGKALDEMRGSYKTVKNKMNSSNNGEETTHRISEDDIEVSSK